MQENRQTSTDAKDRIGDAAARAQKKVQETADQARDSAAGGMRSAADKLREKTTGSGGIQEAAGTRLAEGMDKTARYLREHDTQSMLSDLESYVRQHPARSIIAAVAAGLLIGRRLR